jgi:hypothetical protein
VGGLGAPSFAGTLDDSIPLDSPGVQGQGVLAPSRLAPGVAQGHHHWHLPSRPTVRHTVTEANSDASHERRGAQAPPLTAASALTPATLPAVHQTLEITASAFQTTVQVTTNLWNRHQQWHSSSADPLAPRRLESNPTRVRQLPALGANLYPSPSTNGTTSSKAQRIHAQLLARPGWLHTIMTGWGETNFGCHEGRGGTARRAKCAIVCVCLAGLHMQCGAEGIDRSPWLAHDIAA